MKREHLFFDLDGTLTDSMLGITKATQYALKRYGIVVEDLNELRPFVGPPLHESFMKYYNFNEKDAQDAILVFREYYNETGWLENTPYEGIETVLQELIACGKKLYVATSKPEWMAKRVLDHFGLSVYFTFIGGADDAESRVKKGDVIQYVLDQCNLNDKGSIVMIGDREHDIIGAHKKGIDAVGVLYGYGDREEMEQIQADWITETPATLLELLKSM